jgi:hypothetical protein
MAEIKNRVRFWRGTAESYETIKKSGLLNYWTRYSVKYTDVNGLVTWKEFYGDNPLTEEPGQLLPVIDIVTTLPTVLNPGDRYWVSDQGENYIVDVTVGVGDDLSHRVITLKEGMGVRIKNRNYKSYLLVNNEVVTYDEVNCGTYE